MLAETHCRGHFYISLVLSVDWSGTNVIFCNYEKVIDILFQNRLTNNGCIVR